jgi:hypothetical protein
VSVERDPREKLLDRDGSAALVRPEHERYTPTLGPAHAEEDLSDCRIADGEHGQGRHSAHARPAPSLGESLEPVLPPVSPAEAASTRISQHEPGSWSAAAVHAATAAMN